MRPVWSVLSVRVLGAPCRPIAMPAPTPRSRGANALLCPLPLHVDKLRSQGILVLPTRKRRPGKMGRGSTMQAGDSGREHRGPDAATRLRLLSVQTAGGPFEFGGGLACVHTPPAARTAVAEEIARAVIGPRAAGVDGTLEIAGRYVALHSLPAPLLRPSAAATIDRSMLDDLWRDMCAQEHAEVAATHAARRLDRHRTDAAIERARERAAR